MILQLTNGVTTIDFADPNSGYKLLRPETWSPYVPTRSLSPVGGLLYNDAPELLQIGIQGDSTAVCLQRIENLAQLLDQAERWGRGANVPAVLFRYQPDGSELSNPLQSVVTGPVQGQPFLQLPGRFEAVSRGYFVRPIGLSFTRRGLWLAGATETQTSSAFPISSVMFMPSNQFGESWSIPAPYSATVSADNASMDTDGFLIFTNDTAKIKKFEAEVMSYSTPFRDMSESIEENDLASGGNYLSVQLHEAGEISTSSPVFDSGLAPLWAIFASCRRVNSNGYISAVIGNRTRQYPIANIGDNPEIVFLGLIAGAGVERSLSISLMTPSNSQTIDIDIDYYVAVGIDEATSIVTVRGGQHTYEINDNALSMLNPSTNIDNYDGNLYLNNVGQTVAAVFLATDGIRWRPRFSGLAPEEGVPQSTSFSISRRRSYLTPQ